MASRFSSLCFKLRPAPHYSQQGAPGRIPPCRVQTTTAAAQRARHAPVKTGWRAPEGWTNYRISQQDAGSGAERGVDCLSKSQLRRSNHSTPLRSVWQGPSSLLPKEPSGFAMCCWNASGGVDVGLRPLHTGKSCKQPGRQNLFGCAVCSRPPHRMSEMVAANGADLLLRGSWWFGRRQREIISPGNDQRLALAGYWWGTAKTRDLEP